MKIINDLTKKHILKNKKRSLVTVIAITLTSTLLFVIGFAYSTYREHELKIALKKADYDAIFKEIPYEKHNVLDNDSGIKEYSYVSLISKSDISYITGGDSSYSSTLTFYSISDNMNIGLKSGRLPKNSDEVVLERYVANDLKLNIGDKYVFNFKKDDTSYQKEYTLVGITETDSISYGINAISYHSAFTKEEVKDSQETYFYVYLKNKHNAYDTIFNTAKKLDLKPIYILGTGDYYNNLYTNDSLLKLYGNYLSPIDYAFIYVSLIVILTVLSIACTAIIYNSFAISLTERKKQFGILKSVGATNKQIRKLVFKEAFYISLVAIPLGFITSYFGTSIIVNVINNIIRGTKPNYTPTIYPSFLIISLIFIILTIIYSAFFPAIRASEITPIEAIKQTKDIKNKHKKKHPLINKLFGVCGLISYNNIKRNKKKYRITTFAVVVSVILFISIATFINYFEKNLNMSNQIDTSINLELSGNTLEVEKTIKDIKSLKGINNVIIQNSGWVLTNEIPKNLYTSDYLKYFQNEKITYLISLDNESLNKIKKQYNIKNDNPIYVNYYDYNRSDNDENTVRIKGNVFNPNQNIELEFCNFSKTPNELIKGTCTNKYKINLINKVDGLLKEFELYNRIIVKGEIYKEIIKENDVTIRITSDDYIALDNKINNILKNSNTIYYYTNNGVENYETIIEFSIIKLITFSIIFLFAMISITSIINTVNANMTLRKSEFAILKSVGLDNKQLNKMLILEGIFISIKALLYAIPLCLLIVYFISNLYIIGDKKYTFAYMFPTKYFIITVILVFVIIISTILLAAKKHKKTNIIEAIREENI